MGLLDKVKQQAEQAVAKAQQGVSQGQAKLDDMQAKKRSDALLRDLGAAYYAQQRQAGSAEAVTAALAAVDEHAAAHGPVDSAPSAGDDAGGSAPAATPAGASASSGGSAPSGGDYKLDDL